jgi:hypothetical protein
LEPVVAGKIQIIEVGSRRPEVRDTHPGWFGYGQAAVQKLVARK